MKKPKFTEKQKDTKLKNFRTHLLGELNLRDSTIENYIGVMKRAIPHLGLKFTQKQAHTYLAKMREDGSSYAHLTVTAVGLERYLKFLGIKNFKLSRPKKVGYKEIEPLTDFEIGLMIWNCPDLRRKTMLSIMAYSGLRNSEICNLRIKNVDVNNRIIHVEDGKGGKPRVVNISGDCVALVAEYLKSINFVADEYLFTTTRHKYQLAPQDIRKIVRSVAKCCGITKRIYPHLFRHSMACSLVKNGADIFTVQYQLGHKHLSTTFSYLHPTKELAEKQYHACVASYLPHQPKFYTQAGN